MWSNALYVSLESVGVTGTIYLGIVRFNHFKHKYQEDVKFVLVADTATKSLGTAMTFMFLGHLSSSIGIDIGMLNNVHSNFIVSITPQAVSAVHHPEFWSQIHSLWLISAMLPKFLIVPDIIIEVLSATHPPLLVNRTMVHFFICIFLLMISIVVCSPGGASIATIIFHNHDQYVRFVILMLESLGCRDCTIPLPTWMPANWEEAMLQRQIAMAEGFSRQQEERRMAELKPQMPAPREKSSGLSTTDDSDSEVLGTHLVVASDGAHASRDTSGWRYSSSDELDATRKPISNIIPESGTLHVSRKISSILNIVRQSMQMRRRSRASARSVKLKPQDKKPKAASKKTPSSKAAKPDKGTVATTGGAKLDHTAVDAGGPQVVRDPEVDLAAAPAALARPEAAPAPGVVTTPPTAKQTKAKKVR
ncbi:unnamed protein product, partial [Ixodes hexagonus]